MDKKFRFLALVLIALVLCSCHRRGSGDIHVAGDVYSPTPAVTSPYKVKVVDVSNDTHKVFDVDVIGLLWNGMEDSLKKRGMLWTPQSQVEEPYTLEGHVVDFKKGYTPYRVVPFAGDTLVSVRVDIMKGGRHIGTVESKEKIAFGSHLATWRAYREAFDKVSEDVISQATKKF